MTHSLTLGSLLLTRSFPDADHGYVFDVLAEGVGFGVAAGVQEVVTSLLADGDLMRTSRYGNREVTFAVEITGPSLSALAHGEAALRREVGRSNTLTWQAPDVLSVPTVFEVVTSEMSQTFDDLDELKRRRKFTLTLTCAPFARSADPVTAQAIAPPPATPTNITVTNADTTTGWNANANTGAGSVAVTVEDAGAYVRATATCFSLTLGWTPPSPVSLAGTQYLLIETSSSPTGFYVLYAGDSAVTYVSPALSRMLPAGTVQYAFRVNPARTLGYIGLLWDNAAAGLPGPSYASLTVHDVTRTDTLPQVSSRQTSAVIPGAGTERSPASINIAPGGAGTSLGWTIVHTTPETLRGYSPALRQYRLSGNAITGTSAPMSGGSEPVNTTPVVAQVPLASLPEGEYALVALMRSTAVGTFPIFYEARTLLPGIGYLGGTSDTVSATFTAANTWTLIPLDVVTLPPVRSNGAFVQLNLSRAPVASEVIDLDEWWTLRMGDDCATTILYDNAAFLWLDSPDVSSGVPRIWVGGNGNRSDAHHPSYNLYAQGAHALHPGGTAIFVATSGLEYPNVSATYYPRYHSNAAS